MSDSTRYDQIRKLINAGYPLHVGISILLVIGYSLVKLGISLFTGKGGENLTVGSTIAIIMFLVFLGALAWVFIRIGLEAKGEEDHKDPGITND